MPGGIRSRRPPARSFAADAAFLLHRSKMEAESRFYARVCQQAESTYARQQDPPGPTRFMAAEPKKRRRGGNASRRPKPHLPPLPNTGEIQGVLSLATATHKVSRDLQAQEAGGNEQTGCQQRAPAPAAPVEVMEIDSSTAPANDLDGPDLPDTVLRTLRAVEKARQMGRSLPHPRVVDDGHGAQPETPAVYTKKTGPEIKVPRFNESTEEITVKSYARNTSPTRLPHTERLSLVGGTPMTPPRPIILSRKISPHEREDTFTLSRHPQHAVHHAVERPHALPRPTEVCKLCTVARVGGGFMVLGYGKRCEACAAYIDVDLGKIRKRSIPPVLLQKIQEELGPEEAAPLESVLDDLRQLEGLKGWLRRKTAVYASTTIVTSKERARQLQAAFDEYKAGERVKMADLSDRILDVVSPTTPEGSQLTEFLWPALERAEGHHGQMIAWPAYEAAMTDILDELVEEATEGPVAQECAAAVAMEEMAAALVREVVQDEIAPKILDECVTAIVTEEMEVVSEEVTQELLETILEETLAEEAKGKDPKVFKFTRRVRQRPVSIAPEAHVVTIDQTAPVDPTVEVPIEETAQDAVIEEAAEEESEPVEDARQSPEGSPVDSDSESELSEASESEDNGETPEQEPLISWKKTLRRKKRGRKIDIKTATPLAILRKFCIIQPKQKEEYTNVFKDLDPSGTGQLTKERMAAGLKELNANMVSEGEIDYISTILDLFKEADPDSPTMTTVDLKTFIVTAALSRRIAALDPIVRDRVNKADYGALVEKKKAALRMFTMDANAQCELTKDSLEVILDSGRVHGEEKEAVLNLLTKDNSSIIAYIDYLAYLPLFVDIHSDIVANSLDNTPRQIVPDQHLARRSSGLPRRSSAQPEYESREEAQSPTSATNDSEVSVNDEVDVSMMSDANNDREDGRPTSQRALTEDSTMAPLDIWPDTLLGGEPDSVEVNPISELPDSQSIDPDSPAHHEDQFDTAPDCSSESMDPALVETVGASTASPESDAIDSEAMPRTSDPECAAPNAMDASSPRGSALEDILPEPEKGPD